MPQLLPEYRFFSKGLSQIERFPPDLMDIWGV